MTDGVKSDSLHIIHFDTLVGRLFLAACCVKMMRAMRHTIEKKYMK